MPSPPPGSRESFRDRSDEALAAAAAGADGLPFFDELVWRYQGRLMLLARRLGLDAHAAEDAVQETFVKAFRGIGRFDSRRPFAPWLFTIGRNTCTDQLRRRYPEPAELPDPADDRPPARDGGIWTYARQVLPLRAFSLLWMRYGEGMTVADAARATGVSTVHAKVMLHRARRRLAALLAQEDPAACPRPVYLPESDA